MDELNIKQEPIDWEKCENFLGSPMRGQFLNSNLADFSTLIAGNLGFPTKKNESFCYQQYGNEISNVYLNNSTILAGNFVSQKMKNEDECYQHPIDDLTFTKLKQDIEESPNEFCEVNLLDTNLDAISINVSCDESHDYKLKINQQEERLVSQKKTDFFLTESENDFSSECSRDFKLLSVDKINSFEKKDKKVSRFPLTDIKPNEIPNRRSSKNQQTMIHFPYKCYYVPKQQYIKRSKLKKPEIIVTE